MFKVRLRVVLAAAIWLVAVFPAWAWLRSEPGGKHWPPIPEPGGMANFIYTWIPMCNDGAWQQLGRMTLHADGKISYEHNQKKGLASQYRVIETTPHYVALMTHRVTKEYGELMRFVILQPLTDQPSETMGWNECQPTAKDLAGFKWTDDDAALAHVWAQSKSCNPNFKVPYEGSPFFGNTGWSQECYFWRGKYDDKRKR